MNQDIATGKIKVSKGDYITMLINLIPEHLLLKSINQWNFGCQITSPFEVNQRGEVCTKRKLGIMPTIPIMDILGLHPESELPYGKHGESIPKQSQTQLDHTGLGIILCQLMILTKNQQPVHHRRQITNQYDDKIYENQDYNWSLALIEILNYRVKNHAMHTQLQIENRVSENNHAINVGITGLIIKSTDNQGQDHPLPITLTFDLRLLTVIKQIKYQNITKLINPTFQVSIITHMGMHQSVQTFKGNYHQFNTGLNHYYQVVCTIMSVINELTKGMHNHKKWENYDEEDNQEKICGKTRKEIRKDLMASLKKINGQEITEMALKQQMIHGNHTYLGRTIVEISNCLIEDKATGWKNQV